MKRVVRLLGTMQAVHEAAQWRLDFDPVTQRVAIHSLGVRRAGEHMEHAHAERLRILQREESLDRLVLDGSVTVVALLEDVRVGDVLDVSYTIQSTPRLLAGHYWLFTTVPVHVAVRSFWLSVRFPAGRALGWKSSAKEFAPEAHDLEGETAWTWHSEGRDAQEPEPGSPPWHFANAWVQVSDFDSWGRVVTGMLDAWQEGFDEELLRAATRIAFTAGTPAARATLAIEFIQDEIRYLSVNTGLGGQIPAAPGVVLKRRFGDCKDKAFLAAHLLRRLGIPARPVLVHTVLRNVIEQLLPTPDAFNHAIVEFEIDGQRRLVDMTIPMQGGGAMARSVPDYRLGLPLAPGVAALEKLPTQKTKDRYELRETFLIDTSGRASSLRVTVAAMGSEAETLRRGFAAEGFEAMARKREQFYQQMFGGLKRVGNLEWRDDRARNEVLLAEVFDVQQLLERGPDPQSAIFSFRAHAAQSALSFPEGSVRKHPLALPHPCNIEHWIEIESPTLLRAEQRSAKSSGIAFRLKVESTHQAGRCSVYYSLNTLQECVQPEDYENHKAKIRELWPWTQLSLVLPLGGAIPWRKRSSDHLLPKPRPANSVMEDPVISELPAEPASPLPSSPLPPVSSAGPVANGKLHSPIKTTAPPPESPPVFARRRRHSRRWGNHPLAPLWVGIGLFILLVVVFAFIGHLSNR